MTVPWQDVYPALQDAVISHSHPLRLAASRLLACPIISATQSEREIIQKCVQGESISLDVQGVRERILRIGRIGQTLKDRDDLAAEICSRWLICLSLHHYILKYALTAMQLS